MPRMLVVYHYNPTSNRNALHYRVKNRQVVYHYNPTSIYNLFVRDWKQDKMEMNDIELINRIF